MYKEGAIVELAQVGGQVDGLEIDTLKIVAVGQTILADCEPDVPHPVRSATGVPTLDVPRESLVGGNAPIGQLTNEGVDAYGLAARLCPVPIGVVGILAQQAIIRLYIAPQGGVVGPGGCFGF